MVKKGKRSRPARPSEPNGQERQDALRRYDNVPFRTYYSQQNPIGVSTPGDDAAAATAATNNTPVWWEGFMSQMRTPLPTTFWINDTDPFAGEVARFLQDFVASGITAPIPWYPHTVAPPTTTAGAAEPPSNVLLPCGWRVPLEKRTFRQDPKYQVLRQFLIRQTAAGTINRQEEVSMIPPLLLDIQSTDICLDMCASPGSKTAQMLVALGRAKMRGSASYPAATAQFPYHYQSRGLVVANELDQQRSNMLVHQVKRLRLLYPFALFTCHDARYLPFPATKEGTPIEYDKILCDVVCTGDGTLRKAPYMFRKWALLDALKIQKMQIEIALRGCALLKAGGRMVYSTCSLNPLENEAVVKALIDATDGAMEVIEVAPSLVPHLRYDAGWTSWKVVDMDGKERTLGDTENAPPVLDKGGRVKVEKEGKKMLPAFFPPATVEEAKEKYGLHRCMRFLPHHCEGGGFFVAVLHKKKAWYGTTTPAAASKVPSTASTAAAAADVPATTVEVTMNPDSAVAGAGVTHSVPPTYVVTPASITSTLLNDYGAHGFPIENLIVRLPTGEKEWKQETQTMQICLVSDSALEVLNPSTNKLTIVSAGLRVLASERLGCGWRISNESAPIFSKFMESSPRMVSCRVQDIVWLLQGGNLHAQTIKTAAEIKAEEEEEAKRTAAAPADAAQRPARVVRAIPEEYQAFVDRVRCLPVGAFLLRIVDAPIEPMYCAGLRARQQVQLLVDQEDASGLRCRLGLLTEQKPAAGDRPRREDEEDDDNDAAAAEDDVAEGDE